MPSTSKSQQRLFGWALSCKRGTSKKCPASVQKLADTMGEDELEKFAKTSHEGLPNKVKESLDAIFNIYTELVEAEIGESLETYEYEINEKECSLCHGKSTNIRMLDDDKKCKECGKYVSSQNKPEEMSEGKTIKVEQPDGKKLVNAKKDDKIGKLSDAKDEKTPAAKEIPDAKIDIEGKKNEIPLPKGKKLADEKTVPAASKESKVDKTMPPSVDNKKDEADTSWEKPYPGMEKAEKNVMGNVYTPSIHKFPMGKAKNERRVYDFDGFLKIINYKTHDGIEQKGHGQNLTGDHSAA
jgi:hypothetical protein